MKTDGSRFTWGRSRPANRRETPRTWSLTDTCRAVGVMFLTLVPGHLLALEGAPARHVHPRGRQCGRAFALGEVIARGRWSEADSRGDDPVAFGIATLALVNGLTLLAVTGQAQDSIYLLLLIVGASYFIRSARWLLTFIGLTLVGGTRGRTLRREPRRAPLRFRDLLCVGSLGHAACGADALLEW